MKAYTAQELYRIAMAAGADEANRRMKREGRTTWNESDYAAACETFKKIYGSR